MRSWLSPKAFAVGALLMALQQSMKLQDRGLTTETLIEAGLVIVLGGLFWGVIGTWLYSRFSKK